MPCHLISFIYIFSSLLSIFSITFLALTRNRMIVNPIYTSFAKTQVVYRCLLFGIISLLTLSATIVSVHDFGEGNISQSSSFCLLVGNLGDFRTIRFMTLLLAIVEFVAILVNISLYTHLLRSPHQQKQALAEMGGKGKRSIKMTTVTQLLLVGTSNILCWAPGGILNIISLSVKGYSINALLWVTAFATPLNGTVNPVVFNYSFLTDTCQRQQNDNKAVPNQGPPLRP